MRITLYGYHISPIDWWNGCIDYDSFLRSAVPYDEVLITTMLTEAMRLAREEMRWQGDVREGPYVFALPDTCSCQLGVAWKQDNNGDTFVFSIRELPWLLSDAHAAGSWDVEIPKAPMHSLVSNPCCTEPLFGWSVTVNSDLTEGRGFERIKHLCTLEATARRLARGANVQGSDGVVKRVSLFRMGAKLYGPVELETPTRADERAQQLLDGQRKVREKAKKLGLNEDELKLLAGETDATMP